MEFRDVRVSETRDLDENTLLDLDAQGDVCAITVEHAVSFSLTVVYVYLYTEVYTFS